MKLKISYFLFIITILGSCSFASYKFTDGEAKYNENKKILIEPFENNSGNGPASITSTFTNKTKDYFLQNGDFTVIELNEDLRLQCNINSYNVDYSGANSNETAQQYKLTITVEVTFLDYEAELDKDKEIKKTISNFDFFDPNTPLADVEAELIESISEKIITDIFNQTTMTTDW